MCKELNKSKQSDAEAYSTRRKPLQFCSAQEWMDVSDQKPRHSNRARGVSLEPIACVRLGL